MILLAAPPSQAGIISVYYLAYFSVCFVCLHDFVGYAGDQTQGFCMLVQHSPNRATPLAPTIFLNDCLEDHQSFWQHEKMLLCLHLLCVVVWTLLFPSVSSHSPSFSPSFSGLFHLTLWPVGR